MASLAEIVLEPASDYYYSDNDKTLSSLKSSLEKQDLEQTSLQLKDQGDRKKTAKLLLRLYRDQQNAYEIAITLPGVRKDEARKQISDRCKKQMQAYSLELIRNATAKHKEKPPIIPPKPATVIVQEEDLQQLIDKINQLFEDPLLPLEYSKRWGAYPECEYDEILETVSIHAEHGTIARKLTELEPQYQRLAIQLAELKSKKIEYLEASKIDLTTISDVSKLKQIKKNIHNLQQNIKEVIKQTEKTTATINDSNNRIMNKYGELSTKPIKQVDKIPEEKAARLARMAEEKAKRKADKQNAIQNEQQEAEIATARQERIANQQQELELEARIAGYVDPTGEEKEHFTRAYAALQHLRDIRDPKEQITPHHVYPTGKCRLGKYY